MPAILLLPQCNGILSSSSMELKMYCSDTKFNFLFAGKLIHSMVAHLDSVTSLAVDPNGLYLLSGSKLYYYHIVFF